MRLKNKKTGEIEEFEDITRVFKFIGNQNTYSSLAELNAEWEDVPEETKECEYWYIEADGQILQCHKPKFIYHLLDKQKAIGNYFETKEEAEKAVEKLKAWKRLKDNGFKFQFWTSSYSGDNISFFIDWINADSKKEIEKDLDLLFSQEED